MTEQTTSIPVNEITGFLGSGKTTLLQRLLAAPGLADTAVLVNEFGEVGLDHHLLQRLDDEIVLLQSGCLCCTIRGDLSGAMRDLYSRRERGEIRPFRRLVVETTGLADPVPILSTVMAEPVLRHHFRLGNVVTTVDAVNGLMHLERQEESAKQAAVADRIVITKADIEPDPLYQGPRICDPASCGVCIATCPMGALGTERTNTVVIGGKAYEYGVTNTIKCFAGIEGLLKKTLGFKDLPIPEDPTWDDISKAREQIDPRQAREAILINRPTYYCGKCLAHCPAGK